MHLRRLIKGFLLLIFGSMAIMPGARAQFSNPAASAMSVPQDRQMQPWGMSMAECWDCRSRS